MKKLFLFISCLIANFCVNALQNILIYSGPGAGPQSVQNTKNMIQSLVSESYSVKTVSFEEIIAGGWQDNTALLIIPGGADKPYLEKLGGIGNRNIRNFVEKGGKILGICAGAYYCADRIEFDKGGPLEVIGERELKFFPGLIEGPTYSGFAYSGAQNVSGMRAAKIYWHENSAFASGREFFVFYNGGGHFVDAHTYPNVVVLARYSSEVESLPDHQPAAIVQCDIGDGRAILSGLHFEWEPTTIAADPLLMGIIRNKLVAENDNRIELAQHLLNRLDIKLK